MVDTVRRRRGLSTATSNGANKSQGRPDSESRSEAEWVAERPMKEEDLDSCGYFIEAILSKTINDPDLIVYTNV